MSCAHDGLIREVITKRFIYPDNPDDGEWEILTHTETCETCGKEVYRLEQLEKVSEHE